MDGAHALRGLHGQGGDRGDTVTIVRRKRLQVGSDTGTAGWIKSRDRQQNRWRVIRVVVQLAACPPREAQMLSAPFQRGQPAERMYARASSRAIGNFQWREEPAPGRRSELGEKPADKSRVGDATDREGVGAGAHVRAMPASRFVHFLEGAPHHRFELGVHFRFRPEEAL